MAKKKEVIKKSTDKEQKERPQQAVAPTERPAVISRKEKIVKFRKKSKYERDYILNHPEPVLCNICGSYYDSNVGKGIKHKVWDFFQRISWKISW